MQRTIITPDNSGYLKSTNFFIHSFYEEGHIIETDSYYIEGQYAVNIDFIVDKLEEVFPQSNINLSKVDLTLESPHGALTLNHGDRGQENATFIHSAAYTLTPEKKVALFQMLDTLPLWTPPVLEPDGIFTVFDFFTDALGKTKRKEHRMNTSKMNGIRDDLYPGIDVDKLVNSFLGSKENILILVGLPGTGKTTFMKKVLQTMSFKTHGPRALYTKDMTILEKPEFWSEKISMYNPDFLVLDDLDKELTPRTDVDSNFIVNQLLSFSNGLFENNMKVIITTNLVDEGIDSAVLRPGRCFDVLNLPFLEVEYAKDLWLNIDNRTEAEWDELFPADAEKITQALYMANLESLTMDTNKSYLSNKSISVREKYLGV